MGEGLEGAAAEAAEELGSGDTGQMLPEGQPSALERAAGRFVHPLERLFHRHVDETLALAGHVKTIAGTASEAAGAAQRAAERADGLFKSFRMFAEDVGKRFGDLESRLKAVEEKAAPALSPEVERKAEDLSAAVKAAGEAAGEAEAPAAPRAPDASATEGGNAAAQNAELPGD